MEKIGIKSLDRASVRCLALLLPQDGVGGSVVQSLCACSAPKSVHRGRVGLAGPVVQVVVSKEWS